LFTFSVQCFEISVDFFLIAWHFLFRRSFLPRKESVDRRSSQCHPGLAPPKRELFLRLPKGAEAPQCHLQQLPFELLAPQRTSPSESTQPLNRLPLDRKGPAADNGIGAHQKSYEIQCVGQSLPRLRMPRRATKSCAYSPRTFQGFQGLSAKVTCNMRRVSLLPNYDLI